MHGVADELGTTLAHPFKNTLIRDLVTEIADHDERLSE